MVEVRENRTWFLDGGFEVQGNFFIKIFQSIRVSYLRVQFSRRVRSLERSQPCFARSGVSAVVFPTIIWWLVTYVWKFCWRFWSTGEAGKHFFCRGMAVGAKVNSCHRYFGVCVGMERPNGDVDERYFRIWGLTEKINHGLVSLAGCTFNGVYWVTRYGEK